ncbi:hypothetical protein SK128_013321 [Halocaridina rubra]|uniref:Uncharacterized protein n=1 Tax=Halocaridina rubra TaxID=373956 RepID=A0AAN8XGD3_HALRR
MVISFKRSGDSGELSDKNRMKKTINNGKMPKQSMNMNIYMSRENDQKGSSTLGQRDPPGIYIKSNEKQDNDGNNGIEYRKMSRPIVLSESREYIGNNLSKQANYLEASNGDASELQELCLDKPALDVNTSHDTALKMDRGQYLRVSDGDDRERHHSFTSHLEEDVKNDLKNSSSQPDLTALPSLNIHINGPKRSSSNFDILVTTLEIQDNQIRSVSVGDMSIISHNDKLQMSLSGSCVGVQSYKDQKMASVVNPNKPVLWQPSVDYLYGSPILFRRNFHVRRPALVSKSSAVSKDSDKQSEKKSSVTNARCPKHLGVASLITNVKRSFTDLLSLDVDPPGNLGSETSASYVSKDSDKQSEKKSNVTSARCPKHLGVASLITNVKRSFTDLLSLDVDPPGNLGSETSASYVRRNSENHET